MAASLAPTGRSGPVEDDDGEVQAESSADAAYRVRRDAERSEEARQRAERKATTSGQSTPLARPESPLHTPDTASTITTGASSGIGSLLGNRAQMEKERLARQAARAGSSSTATAQSAAPSMVPVASATFGPTALPKARTPPPVVKAEPLAAKRSYVQISPNTVNKRNGIHSLGASGSRSAASTSSRHPFRATGNIPRDTAGEYYLNGEMRHTALTIGNASDAPTFSPKEVIGNVS